MLHDKEIALSNLVVIILLTCFGALIPPALSQTNGTTPLVTTVVEENLIKNSDILQACVTVLIGILFFLTLERKFEKKYDPKERSKVEQRIDYLESIIEKKKEGIKEFSYPDAPSTLGSIANFHRKKKLVDKDIDENLTQLKKLKEYLKSDTLQREIEDDIAYRLRILKNREKCSNANNSFFISGVYCFHDFRKPQLDLLL